MDGLWDPPNYQASEGITYGNNRCQCALCLAYDVIEETALNDKSCIQVLRILISKADTNIVELEEELINLLSQLACTDEEFSDMFSMSLRLKIDFLDLSIRKLKDDAGDFSPTSREPAESIDDILKALFCRYLQKKDKQFADNISNVASSYCQVHADNPFGEKKQMGSSPNANQMEKNKSVIITALEKHTNSKTTVKTEEENANHPESTKCTSPVSKYSALCLFRGSMEKMKQEVNKFQTKSPTITKAILQNMTPRGNSICQKPSTETQGKWRHQLKMIMSQTDNESIGSRSDPLEESSEEPNAKPEITRELVFSLDNRDKSNSISLEARNRTETTSGLEVPNASLIDTERSAPDTLLELSDHRINIEAKSVPKKGRRSQPKLVREYVASSKDEGNTNLVLKHVRNQEEGDSISNPEDVQEPSVSLCLSLSSTKTYKRRQKLNSLLQTSSSSPCLLEGAKESCSLGIDVANPHDDSGTETETRGSLDMDYYTVDDLKAIAKQRKMKGYTKLRKSELAQVLGIKLIEGKKKQKRKETLPL